MSDPPRTVTIEGTVLGAERSEDLVVWAELTVGTQSWSRWTVRSELSVRLDDGSTVTVHVQHRSMELFPSATRRGRYGELERDPIVAAFREHAPAPHVRASLRSAHVRPGDRVVVDGDVVDQAQEGGSLRTPATTRIAAVRAHAIGVGTEGAAEVARWRERRAARARGGKPRAWALPALALGAPREPWGHWVWLAAAGAFAALAAGDLANTTEAISAGIPGLVAFPVPRPSPRAIDLAILALDYVAVAIAWRMQTAALPSFVRNEARVPPPWRVASAVFVSLFLTLPMIIFFAAAGDLRGEPLANGVPVTATLGAIIAFLLLLFALREAIPSIRYARIVLAAPPHPGDLRADAWGATLGVVDDPTPVSASGRSAAIALVEEEEVTEGSSPNIDRTRLLCTDTFFVVRDDGARVEVLPRDGAWSSAVRFRPEKGGKRTVPVSTELVPDGAAIVVVGRVSHQGATPVLRARGPESLFFYASPAGTDPRAHLRLGTAVRALGLAALLAIAIAPAVIAWAAAPVLPAFNPIVADSD